MQKPTYDWVNNIVAATTILGWSEEQFWKSGPRKFYAFLYTYIDLNTQIQNAPKQEVLVGRAALGALTEMASRIR